MPCTKPIESEAKSVSEIINELEKTKTKERDGRDNTKEGLMEGLRALGYM